MASIEVGRPLKEELMKVSSHLTVDLKERERGGGGG